MALLAAIIVQAAWVVIGTITHKDPYPFAFLLTLSNMIQLVLIFVIAVAQKDQGDDHDTRHESIHQRFDHILEVLRSHGSPSDTETNLPGR